MEGVLMRSTETVAKPGALPMRSVGFSESIRIGSIIRRIGFGSARRRATRVGLKSVRAEMVVEKKKSPPKKNLEKGTPIELFVGLPLDSVTTTVNHPKAISAGLRALKLLGIHGVELPIFWSIAQPDSSTQFEWAGYLALAAMVRAAGLRLRVSLHLHASRRPNIALPSWVSRAAAVDPNILFTDRSGQRHMDCLSFAVDEVPVLEGKTPIECYKGFFHGFREAFAEFFGSTITEVSVSLGPNGELRYPSFPPTTTSTHPFTGVGEFQCYDKYMMSQLKRHADESNNPLWGLSGPHDAPAYHQSPDSTDFFKNNGGKWETPYGDFFLSWYSKQLLNHGDRVLSVASKMFDELPVQLSAKVPLLHWWHNTRSCPAELTAGFYNTDRRNGYDAVAELFARNSCTMVIAGMDSSESPPLLSQITRACEKHGVRIAGENSSLGGFGRIKENLMVETLSVGSFTYQRMGAEFFSPEHWPTFAEFVGSVKQTEMDSDDLVSTDNKDNGLSLPIGSAAPAGNDREMQAV
ncbi:inactive beta-amylase 9 [Typha latifolia]|uniref:inactive beta-amylase 9 n=1 Tax=Typha latifolia TaxID=4733 RepID=UPI003C2DE075